MIYTEIQLIPKELSFQGVIVVFHMNRQIDEYRSIDEYLNR